MVYPNTNLIRNQISQPTSKIDMNNVAPLVLGITSASLVIDEDSKKNQPALKTNSDFSENANDELNLWQFSRLYEFQNIPIVDFFLFYIILYSINAIYFNYNYKFILVSTIPLTIVFNIIINPSIQLTNLLMIMIVTSLCYLAFACAKCLQKY